MKKKEIFIIVPFVLQFSAGDWILHAIKRQSKVFPKKIWIIQWRPGSSFVRNVSVKDNCFDCENDNIILKPR